MILAIDPGNKESAFVFIDNKLFPVKFGKVENMELLDYLKDAIWEYKPEHLAIEMVASYGMPVGKEVFETCVWIGRFIQFLTNLTDDYKLIYRKDEKMDICHIMKAKDSNIRQALIDRFGPVGVKKNPGWFYGFKKDIWQAYAVGVTYYDIYLKSKEV